MDDDDDEGDEKSGVRRRRPARPAHPAAVEIIAYSVLFSPPLGFGFDLILGLCHGHGRWNGARGGRREGGFGSRVGVGGVGGLRGCEGVNRYGGRADVINIYLRARKMGEGTP